MAYGTKRNQSAIKTSYKYKTISGGYLLPPASGNNIMKTATDMREEKTRGNRSPQYGKKAIRIAELYKRFGNNGIIDMYIKEEFGEPCTKLDWKNALAYLRLQENLVKEPGDSLEKKTDNQRKYLAKIIDCAIKNKDYDLNKLANQLKIITCLDDVEEEKLDECSRAYLAIFREYQKIPFADKKLDVMQRTVSAFNLSSREVVLDSLKYPIQSSQEEWDNFIKERNSLNPPKKSEDLTKK